MKLSECKFFITLAVFLSLSAVSVFAQDAIDTNKTSAAAVATPDAKEIAIYGEVQAVNASSGTISVQYYDYDSDSEKMSDIAVADITKLENAGKIDDIKKSDWVDVTYTVVDGKNVAKVVTVEKEETPATEEAPAAPAADASAE